MSNGDGHSYITFGWLATIIGVLLFFAVLNSQYAETQQSAEYAHKCAEQYKRLAAPSSDVAPKARDQEEPARAQESEYNPDWCDLAAQQSMAESTYWMNVAAIATVIFTAWGAFLIWRTLIATQETVAITRRIGEAQVRAYLDFSEVEYKVTHRRILVKCKIVNTGQSPASNVTASPRLTFVVTIDREPTKAAPTEVSKDEALYFHWEADAVLKHAVEGAYQGHRWEVVVEMTWQDVFGRQSRINAVLVPRGTPERETLGVKVGEMSVRRTSAKYGL